MNLPVWEMFLRLGIAVVLGLIFGLERGRDKKPVGARTHILICTGACITAMISAYGYLGCAAYYPPEISVSMDPARLVVGVLTGIGFIGAGIIWKEPGGAVTGITTAAGVFILAVLGIAAGLGLYLLTAVGSGIAILTLLSGHIKMLLKKFWRKRKQQAQQKGQEKQEKQEK